MLDVDACPSTGTAAGTDDMGGVPSQMVPRLAAMRRCQHPFLIPGRTAWEVAV